MSSQPNTTKIPFSIAHTQQPVRLIELPPAILSLINSDERPTLKIKAAAALPPSQSHNASSTSDHAVLCTADKTFSLRQVHSSNTTFLLTPTASCDSPSSGEVTVTSTVTSYLELLPLPSIADARDLLRPHLLPYPSPPPSPGTRKSRTQLARDTPISDAEFNHAWDSLGAFEHDGCCYIPTPSSLLAAVKEAFTSAAAERITICAKSPFSPDLVLGCIDEDVEIPRPLIVAALASVCDCAEDGWRLNESRCIEATGRWVLQEWHEMGKGDMLYIAFSKIWKSVVPDGCARLCCLDAIKVCWLVGCAEVRLVNS
ncbi:sister chromatid cohesion protein Dcc1 [Sphaerosporella brunnea]|uniref:Sister chromatid cohesion protein Dcc1 n=1 Tax=Sphaerosporella brunnea TaxID=1250544 RepID=A0A5J5EVT3_9PEZI|nr:sister chromatid cohesion protein Dcc1 [Sphaerosporella brunnea]